MPRRLAVLVATAAVALIAGLGASAVGASPRGGEAVAGPADGSGSISATPARSGPSLTAVEPVRGIAAVRPENQSGAWGSSTALLLVTLLAVATAADRGPRLQGLLELSIRSQTEWWRPALGGRAPPPVRTV